MLMLMVNLIDHHLFLSNWSKHLCKIRGYYLETVCFFTSMFILKISHIFPNTFKYFSGISFQFENFESANLLTHDAFKDIT